MARPDENGIAAQITTQAVNLAPATVISIAILILWQVIVVVLKIPEAILPTPVRIFEVMVERYDLS